MKQKSNEIKRLFQFMGKHRTLLNVSRFLSGISALFIMCPFLCVYFAARDLVSIFAGKPIDTGSLVKWGVAALVLELVGLLLYFICLCFNRNTVISRLFGASNHKKILFELSHYAESRPA